MRMAIIVGVLLVTLGAVSLGYQGITYTTREKVLDIGPIEATTEKQKTIPLPPIVGGLALAAGAAILIAGTRRA